MMEQKDVVTKKVGGKSYRGRKRELIKIKLMEDIC